MKFLYDGVIGWIYFCFICLVIMPINASLFIRGYELLALVLGLMQVPYLVEFISKKING